MKIVDIDDKFASTPCYIVQLFKNRDIFVELIINRFNRGKPLKHNKDLNRANKTFWLNKNGRYLKDVLACHYCLYLESIYFGNLDDLNELSQSLNLEVPEFLGSECNENFMYVKTGNVDSINSFSAYRIVEKLPYLKEIACYYDGTNIIIPIEKFKSFIVDDLIKVSIRALSINNYVAKRPKYGVKNKKSLKNMLNNRSKSEIYTYYKKRINRLLNKFDLFSFNHGNTTRCILIS